VTDSTMSACSIISECRVAHSARAMLCLQRRDTSPSLAYGESVPPADCGIDRGDSLFEVAGPGRLQTRLSLSSKTEGV
jgi:hypothetical protein